MVKTETLNTTLSYSPSSSIMEDNSTGKKKRSFVDMDMDMVENDKERSVSPGHGLGPLPSSSLALQLVGKHALLFDDDSAAACINSKEALMPWNGDQNLLLDRYDARHLLQDLSALRRRRSSSSSSDASEAELDLERYRDLHDPPHHETSKRQKSTGSGYQTVPFLYSTEETATAGRTSEEAMESSDFKPPFSVPENLLSHLPPTEKVHQIIARTAKFVSEHGGQSEIVLRVKQGSNPVFGFLMPDHHLHVYFRFLVDHLKVLEADKKSDSEQITKSTAGEALSLLGSVYGTGDDEDEGTAHLSVVIKKEGSSMQDYPVNNIAFSEDTCNLLERAESSVQKVLQKDICSTETDATPNKDALVTDKQASILEGSKCMSGDGLGTHDPNLHNLVKNVLLSVQTSGEKVKDIAPILEPPSFLKRIVQKMAEFIARNGKEFECIIMNQDRSTGRFPFLLPFNQYHTYYLKVLEAAQKGELYEDDAGAEKFISPSDVRVHGVQKIKEPKKNINVAGDSSPCVACTSTPEEMNITQAKKTSDPEKKTKFKIVIGGIRKDGLDHGNGKPPGMTSEAAASSVRSATKRPVRVPGFSQGSGGDKDNEKKESGLSADATAAIVMSATRGLWKSQQGVTSESGTFHGGILEKILKGISEDSDGGGSADVGSSHGDASNICSSNGGMALTQSGHHSGISGTSSKLVMDACFSHQQSGDVSGASGSILRLDGSNMKKDDTSAAKVMVKAAALAAACEADSSEACLSREEKLRAERLKRAKKFAALIKSGCHDLGDKNVRSTHEGVGSLQNESNGKAAVCGSSYNGATIQLDSPKAKTSAKISKEESGQMEVLAASKEHGNKSTAKYPDGDGHSDKNHHHHWNDHHECSKSQHDKSDENGNDYEKYGRRHKHKSEKNHKDSVTERYSGKRHYESNSHRSSEDRHRRHRHCSKSRDMDSGMGGNHHHSREDAHWHWSKNISGQKHTKNSSGKEHRKESSHGKEHTKVSSRGKDHTKESSSGKDHSSKDNQEKSAANLLKHTEALASEARELTTHATDVPDDLRAKVRAMLLATL